MKNILVILLTLTPLLGLAQNNVTLKSGTNYVIVANSVYPKDALMLGSSTSDSNKLSILHATNGSVVISSQAYSYYKRASGNAFASRAALIAWCDSFMFKP